MIKIFLDTNGRKRKGIEVQCQICNLSFLSRIDQARKYCSKQCAIKATEKRQYCECHICKKPFSKKISKLKGSRSKLYFCSRKCKDYAQSLDGSCKEIQPSHYGLGDGKFDYRQRALKAYGNKCELCSWDKTLEAHHIDGNRENNSLYNLCILCPNCHSLTETNKFTLSEEIVRLTESKIRSLRAHMFQGGEIALQANCDEFDSHCVHK